MPKKLTADALWHMARQPGCVVLPHDEVPGVIAALKIKEALERELVEHRRLLKVCETDLEEVAEAKDWKLTRYMCEKRDAYREEIRKIENHLKEGL